MTSQLAIITPLAAEPTALPTSGRLVIGSSSDRADIVLSSQGVADIHCVIAKTKNGGWAIQDMGSEFGTILDGKPIEVARLKAGQTILIASVSIKVVEAGVAPKEEAAAAAEATSPQATPKQEKEPKAAEPPAKALKSHILDIPGYSIQETLGKGGMGAVFRARQDRLNRDVALKILSPRLAADAEFVRRFHKEAQAVAALNHTNVVAVYDIGEASGTHFIAMEYMDNKSLQELLDKEGQLPWERVAEILLDAARGLTYAESKGIIHRDIKPSNLMLNAELQVKIADLGLAQRANDESSDGRIFGTPHFMAPEQILGKTVDRRCDIYSLGATGYQLLTGYTPFEGVSTREILRAVLKDDFEPVGSHVAGIPPALTDLIERMIARDPNERPQSAESVTTHLQSILSGSTQTIKPVRIAPKPRSAPSRAPIIALALAALGAGYLYTKVKDGSLNLSEVTGVGTPPPTQPGDDPTLEETETSSATPTSSDPEGTLVTTEPAPPAEDDTAQKLFESEAEVAFLRMQSSDLTLVEQRAKLLELAKKYDGTTAAARALTKAQVNSVLIDKEEAAAQALLTARQGVLDELNKAAALNDSPTFPAKALAAILAVPGQDALASDEEFSAARALLRDQVCEKALRECRALFEEAQRGLTDPDQLTAIRPLEEIVVRLQVGDLGGLNKPAGFEDLRRLEADARALLSDLDAQRERANADLALTDGATIANYCYGKQEDGLHAHIRNLKLGDAANKLRDLAARVHSQERKAHISQLTSDLDAASAAMNALIENFEKWRRSTVADPRQGRKTAGAISVNADGLTLDSTARGEFISWAAYSANPDSLHTLFNKRLNREWSEEERRGVALILNFTATLNAAEEAEQAFSDPTKLSNKSKEAFTFSDDWIEGDDSIEQNRAAVTALFDSLELGASREWGAAESGIRYTVEQYAGSLLILLLSDGKPPSNETPPPNDAETPETTPLGNGGGAGRVLPEKPDDQ